MKKISYFSSFHFPGAGLHFFLNRSLLQEKFSRIGAKVRKFRNHFRLVVNRARRQDRQKEANIRNHSHNRKHQYCHPRPTGSDNKDDIKKLNN